MTKLERSIVNIVHLVPMAKNDRTKQAYIRQLINLMERRERLMAATIGAR
jgi:hypothetical protein